jgi:hypothetical protein
LPYRTLKKSPSVTRFILYSFRAKNIPNNNRHREAPKGSSITENNPPSRNWDDAPKTVSEPNQVAKSAEVLSTIGKLLPASMKSPDDLTFLEAHRPIRTVTIRYAMTEVSNNALAIQR